MNGIVIIADPEGKGYDFAKGVYDKLSKKNHGLNVVLIDLKRTLFKDKEYKIKIVENVRKKSCFYIHDGNKEPCQWMSDLLFTLEGLKSSSASEINVVFPYMRFARQDRKHESRVSVNAKAILDIVSLYANRAMTIDLHSPQIEEFGSIPFDNLRSFPVVIDHFMKIKSDLLKNLVLVSPDFGGGKRVEDFQKALKKRGIDAGIALGYKKRERDNDVDKVEIIGEVEGKNCLIIDDIIDTGRTIVKTNEALKRKGADRVYVYATHGLFSEGMEKFKNFDGLLTSDSLNNGKIYGAEIISLVDLFSEAIYRTHVGESLSGLFE